MLRFGAGTGLSGASVIAPLTALGLIQLAFPLQRHLYGTFAVASYTPSHIGAIFSGVLVASFHFYTAKFLRMSSTV
jgi:hypothetical protein